jgi:diguanylate cyclase (GGDEF)-like protein
MYIGGFPDAFGEAAPVKRMRRDQRDAIVLFGIAVASFVVSDIYDLPHHIFEFGMAYEDWKVDDIIFVSFVLGIAWIIYGLRRYQDFSREIKARRGAELEARNLARHDPLTGLPNRRFFAEKLDECLRNVSETQRVAILMLDLDGFKIVNDTHGHAVGDKALREFSDRVSVILRPDEVLARIGGDEFAIIMPKIDSLDEPTNLARRIAATVAEPFMIESAAAEFGVGVGIAIAPNDGTDPDELLKRADRALYRAKGAGRSSVRFFEPEMDAHVERRIKIERELRKAIASNGIVSHYQPLVSLDGNSIIGF